MQDKIPTAASLYAKVDTVMNEFKEFKVTSLGKELSQQLSK